MEDLHFTDGNIFFCSGSLFPSCFVRHLLVGNANCLGKALVQNVLVILRESLLQKHRCHERLNSTKELRRGTRDLCTPSVNNDDVKWFMTCC